MSANVLMIDFDKIDVAWKYVHCNHSGETWDSLMTLLSGFGIVACEECRGSGRSFDHHDGGKIILESSCPPCHGHGWRSQ